MLLDKFQNWVSMLKTTETKSLRENLSYDKSPLPAGDCLQTTDGSVESLWWTEMLTPNQVHCINITELSKENLNRLLLFNFSGHTLWPAYAILVPSQGLKPKMSPQRAVRSLKSLDCSLGGPLTGFLFPKEIPSGIRMVSCKSLVCCRALILLFHFIFIVTLCFPKRTPEI